MASGIFDTDQLSVNRGGSLLYKTAINQVEKEFTEQLEPLSLGASSGLFVARNSDSDGADLCTRIRQRLQQGSHRHLNFIVVHARNGSLQQAKEELYARLRWRQMNSLSAAPDHDENWLQMESADALAAVRKRPEHKPENGDAVGKCALHGRRAGRYFSQPIRRYRDEETNRSSHYSESVHDRFCQGINLRHEFFERSLDARDAKHQTLIERLENYHFSTSIQDLAEAPRFTQLNHKIAVLYFDGNSFGKLQKQLVDTPEKQIEFDQQIQQNRRDFLYTVLTHLLDSAAQADQPGACFLEPVGQQQRSDIDQSDGKQNRNAKEKFIRFETLLWGGDEMMFIVPAWMGMDLLQLFYRESAGWEYCGHRLTHSGGLVFCHYKTPLYRMRQLAQSLADEVKNTQGGRDDNHYQYMVLESVDFPSGITPSEFFKQRFSTKGEMRRPLRPCADWFEQRQAWRELLNGKNALAKGPVHRIADGLVHDFEQHTAERWLERYRELSGEKFNQLSAMQEALFSELPVQEPAASDERKSESWAWSWLHLANLWDYLAPQYKATEQSTPPGQEQRHD